MQIGAGLITLCDRALCSRQAFRLSPQARLLIFCPAFLTKACASFFALRESAQDQPFLYRTLTKGATPAQILRELTFLFQILFDSFSSLFNFQLQS